MLEANGGFREGRILNQRIKADSREDNNKMVLRGSRDAGRQEEN